MTEMGVFEAWFETLSTLAPIAMDKEGNHSCANNEYDISSRVKLILVESELLLNTSKAENNYNESMIDQTTCKFDLLHR